MEQEKNFKDLTDQLDFDTVAKMILLTAEYFGIDHVLLAKFIRTAAKMNTPETTNERKRD